MFPEYIYIYRDKDSFVHLYYYRGLDDNGNYIYNPLNIKEKYIEQLNPDGSIDMKFEDKTIIQFNCNLVSKHNSKNVLLKLN